MVTAGILPFRENSHGRTGNRTRDLMISSQRLWPLDHEAGLSLNVRSWFRTYRASISMTLFFIKITYLCTILYLLSHILIFTPMRFDIHWCHRQGFQSYCGLFLRHPNGENEIAIRRRWEETAVTLTPLKIEWMSKGGGVKNSAWCSTHSVRVVKCWC